MGGVHIIRFKQVSILKRKTADATTIKRARELYKDLFQKMGREEEDGLVADFRSRLTDWQAELKVYAHTAGTPHHPGKADIDAALARIAQQLSTRDSFAFIEALLGAKDVWLDAADDIADLISFYKTQIAVWRKLLDGLRICADNREALDKVPQAATAIVDLTQIRDNPKPYSQISRIEPLLASVTAVNNKLVQEKRERALLSIDGKLAEVQAKLGAATATPDLSNKALRPLQDLKARIASQTSIAQILLLQGAGGDVMDDAINLIEAAATKVSHPQATRGETSKPTQPGQHIEPATVAKTTRVIRAAELSSKTYLESEADVDDFVTKLKDALLAAVRAGQIARIQ